MSHLESTAPEEDVESLQFGEVGAGEPPKFMCNASVALLLERLGTIKYRDGRRPPEVFATAAAYAARFAGAAEGADVPALEDLTTKLGAMDFHRVAESGTMYVDKLHAYEVAALINLSPVSVEAARALLPSLMRLSDDEIGTVLAQLRRGAAAMGTASLIGGGGAGGGAAGGAGAGAGAYA